MRFAPIGDTGWVTQASAGLQPPRIRSRNTNLVDSATTAWTKSGDQVGLAVVDAWIAESREEEAIAAARQIAGRDPACRHRWSCSQISEAPDENLSPGQTQKPLNLSVSGLCGQNPAPQYLGPTRNA